MASSSNPFAKDGTLKDPDVKVDAIADVDSSAPTAENVKESGRTIDLFLKATHDLLVFADDRFYVRRIKQGKSPDHAIHKDLIDFRTKLFHRPDAVRYAFGELAIRGYHDMMQDKYGAIGQDDVSAIESVQHELLVNIKARWIRAGPNVRALIMGHLKTMNGIANAFHLNVSVGDKLSSSTATKLQKSAVLGRVFKKFKGVLEEVNNEFSQEEMDELISAGTSPDVLKGAFAAMANGTIDLQTVMNGLTGLTGGGTSE